MNNTLTSALLCTNSGVLVLVQASARRLTCRSVITAVSETETANSPLMIHAPAAAL